MPLEEAATLEGLLPAKDVVGDHAHAPHVHPLQWKWGGGQEDRRVS